MLELYKTLVPSSVLWTRARSHMLGYNAATDAHLRVAAVQVFETNDSGRRRVVRGASLVPPFSAEPSSVSQPVSISDESVHADTQAKGDGRDFICCLGVM